MCRFLCYMGPEVLLVDLLYRPKNSLILQSYKSREKLPAIKKKLLELDGSVFWMCSHPKQAAKVVCEWFDETLH